MSWGMIGGAVVGVVGNKVLNKPPKAPPPIDATAAAEAQGTANLDAARLTNRLGRPDQTTPYGSLKWTQGGSEYDAAGFDNAWRAWSDAGGVGPVPAKESFGFDPDGWSSTTELSPENQALYSGAQGRATDALGNPLNIPGGVDLDASYNNAKAGYNDFSAQTQGSADLANKGMGGTGQAIDRLSQLNSEAGPQANEAARKAIEQALYSRSTARLDPRFAQEGDQLNTALANQGITQGSEAYNREMQNFSMGKNDAYSSAINDAITNSTSEMAKLHGMELGTREQNARIAQTLGGLGLGTSQNALDWQQASDEQQGMIDTSALNRIGAISANNQDQFNNQLRGRDQALEELSGITAATRPSFEASGGASVGASPVLDALLAQQSGRNANYNVDAGTYNANSSATTQMVSQATAAALEKWQANKAARAGNT